VRLFGVDQLVDDVAQRPASGVQIGSGSGQRLTGPTLGLDCDQAAYCRSLPADDASNSARQYLMSAMPFVGVAAGSHVSVCARPAASDCR
jgi:hypothetical protein